MRSVEPTSAAILIVTGLLLFGAYQVHVLASLLVGGTTKVILPIGATLQAAAALLAAFGIIGVYGWATVALLVLGASALATDLYKAFGLGIVPWLEALLHSALVVGGACVCIVWLRWKRAYTASLQGDRVWRNFG